MQTKNLDKVKPFTLDQVKERFCSCLDLAPDTLERMLKSGMTTDKKIKIYVACWYTKHLLVNAPFYTQRQRYELVAHKLNLSYQVVRQLHTAKSYKKTYLHAE